MHVLQMPTHCAYSGRSDDEDECSDGDEGSESPDEEPQPEEVVMDFSPSVCAVRYGDTSETVVVVRPYFLFISH